MSHMDDFHTILCHFWIFDTLNCHFMEQTFVKTLQKVPICISQSLYPGEKTPKNNTQALEMFVLTLC